MEDSHIAKDNIIPNVHLFGVFDGHGGGEVSAVIAKSFSMFLLKNPSFS
jgi:serine/threonine protein phosphatase PrpC